MKSWNFPLKIFLFATAAAILFRLFVMEPFRVASNSMSPKLKTGEIILVIKSAFSIKLPFSSYELLKISNPKRNERVAFNLPEKQRMTYIKRIAALAGDQLEIRSGQLYVNGKLVVLESGEESVESTAKTSESTVADYGPIEVPPDHFFALGDNRVESLDSRAWGPVPYSCLKGKVIKIF